MLRHGFLVFKRVSGYFKELLFELQKSIFFYSFSHILDKAYIKVEVMNA